MAANTHESIDYSRHVLGGYAWHAEVWILHGLRLCPALACRRAIRGKKKIAVGLSWYGQCTYFNLAEKFGIGEPTAYEIVAEFTIVIHRNFDHPLQFRIGDQDIWGLQRSSKLRRGNWLFPLWVSLPLHVLGMTLKSREVQPIIRNALVGKGAIASFFKLWLTLRGVYSEICWTAWVYSWCKGFVQICP